MSATHRKTCQSDAIALSLCLDSDSLDAVWLAIRTMEDSALSLSYLAESENGDSLAAVAVSRRRRAEEMRRAADILRGHAQRAQTHVTAQRLANERADHGLEA